MIDLWNLTRSYDAILDDECLAIRELAEYRLAGGGSLVDATSGGLGRNPAALRRISEAAGVRIIMGAGWYRERVYPAYVYERDTNGLADLIVTDIMRGADGTDVRAGIIGEIGTERKYITPAEERVFRAAARAHRRTGACVMTHTTHFGELAMELVLGNVSAHDGSGLEHRPCHQFYCNFLLTWGQTPPNLEESVGTRFLKEVGRLGCTN